MSDTASGGAVTRDWDAFWRGTRDGAAYSSAGVSHPVINAFWREVFGALRAAPSTRVLDIACGNGAVVAAAHEVLAGNVPEMVAVDVSAAAVAATAGAHAGVRGVVADAARLPFGDRAFSLVTSQFGIEYAGPAALTEAGRLLASGGTLALLLHSRDGGIYRECADALDAVRAVQRARFIPLARTMVEAGFAARDGGDRERFRDASAALEPAFGMLESVLLAFGAHVAGDTVRRLRDDTRRIQARLAAFDQGEVLDWLKRLDSELEAYAGRMESMCKAALDSGAFNAYGAELKAAGYRLVRASPLELADAPALGWALVARRA